MKTIEPDPDTPARGRDFTMNRLELTESFDQLWPGFSARLAQVQCQREGVLLGWIPGAGPAGALFPLPDGPEQRDELEWDSRRGYLLMRVDEVPDVWVRAYRVRPYGFQLDAFVCSREIEPERGVRRWELLTEQDTPVQVAEDQVGAQPRRWVLRGDLSYDLEWDIDAWKLYGHDTPEGTVPTPHPAHG